MSKFKAVLAIFASMLLGLVIATMITGCQPSEGPPKGDSGSTDAAPTTETPEITLPGESDAPSDEPAPMPTEGNPTGEPTNPAPSPDAPAPAPPKVDEGQPVEGTPSSTAPSKEEEAKTPAKTEDQVALAAAKPDTNDKPKTDDKSKTAAADKPADNGSAPAQGSGSNPVIKAGDWNQWGGTSMRNNTPVADHVPTEWEVPEFDRKTGEKVEGTGQNIKWVAALGSQSYGNTVVASGKVFLGTNNSNGYLKRYPSDYDLGVLVCFNEKDGKFLWQHSSEKLPTGRVHDWPLQGVCCSPLVEGNRLWFVTNRGEVRCLDTEGFYDGEDDGPVKGELGRLFDVMKGDDPATDPQAAMIASLDDGKIDAAMREHFAKAGMELPEEVTVKKDDKAKAPSKKWIVTAKVDGADREIHISTQGPRLSAFKVITPDDKHEADVVWVFDMMKELGTSQHNMCSCSVTSWGDILFVNTSNGVDEAHITIPAPEAPSFMAMNKNTGEVYWTDNSPGKNVLHGQWSSPTVATIGGVTQVIFGGGDGWMYSFKADKGKDGHPELLWKFDANPKKTILELGGRGTRNDIISTPVVYEDKIYFATGQDPEHGEGAGILWCIDPTKRGDISAELAVNVKDRTKPIPVKRIQAVVEAEGDVAIDNPNSGVVWKYSEFDANGDGSIDFEETFHRSISTPAIKDGVLFIPDFSGLFHCVDAKTGKPLWTYDMLAAAWGSPMIAGGYVMIGDEDGDIAIFKATGEKQEEPVNEINMGNSVYSSPIFANGVLYIANKDHVFAIQEGAGEGDAAKEEKAAAEEK